VIAATGVGDFEKQISVCAREAIRIVRWALGGLSMACNALHEKLSGLANLSGEEATDTVFAW